MGLLSFLFRKKNHIEIWMNTPQDMKERLVIATIRGHLSAKRIGSRKPPAVIDQEIDAFIERVKNMGVVKQVTEEITNGYRQHNINEPHGRVMRRFLTIYFESLEQAEREGKYTGMPHY